MTPAQVFARAGQALFGTGQDWKAQFGRALMIRPDGIDAMTKGDSRIPPGVWNEVAGLLQDRERELPGLRLRALELVAQSAAKVVATVTSLPGTNNAPLLPGPNPGPVLWTEQDRAELQAALDDVIRRAELPLGRVILATTEMRVEIPGELDLGALEILTQWFQVNERHRLQTVVSRRTGGRFIAALQGPTQR